MGAHVGDASPTSAGMGDGCWSPATTGCCLPWVLAGCPHIRHHQKRRGRRMSGGIRYRVPYKAHFSKTFKLSLPKSVRVCASGATLCHSGEVVCERGGAKYLDDMRGEATCEGGGGARIVNAGGS
jgi:hypothetical protein